MSTATQPAKSEKKQPAGNGNGTAATKSSRPQPADGQSFLFDKENYKWMIGGVVLILIGFFLMAGGKSPDPHQFNYDEIYSFRRITLAPIIIVAGFVVEVFAIMKKPKAGGE